MRNPPSTGAVPFEGFECDNNGDCLFFGVANIHWYLVDHDEADEDLRKEMSDIHHETNPETSHRRQLDPKTTLGVIHYVIREFPVEPPPTRTRLPGGGESGPRGPGERGRVRGKGDSVDLVAGARALRQGRFRLQRGGDLEAVDYWMFLEDLEGLRDVRRELTDKEFGLAQGALRKGMGTLELGERPPKEVLARRRASRLEGGGDPGPAPGQAAGAAPPEADDDSDDDWGPWKGAVQPRFMPPPSRERVGRARQPLRGWNAPLGPGLGQLRPPRRPRAPRALVRRVATAAPPVERGSPWASLSRRPGLGTLAGRAG